MLLQHYGLFLLLMDSHSSSSILDGWLVRLTIASYIRLPNTVKDKKSKFRLQHKKMLWTNNEDYGLSHTNVKLFYYLQRFNGIF